MNEYLTHASVVPFIKKRNFKSFIYKGRNLIERKCMKREKKKMKEKPISQV